MKKYKTGYTQGAFDMFHVGHLNLINRAKEQCERLVVGVNADALIQAYKNKTAVIPEDDRLVIVRNIKAVDEADLATTLDKVESAKRIGYDAIFIGDDWRGSPRWQKTEEDLAAIGVDVVYLPYTDGVSSTKLRPEADSSIKGL